MQGSIEELVAMVGSSGSVGRRQNAVSGKEDAVGSGKKKTEGTDGSGHKMALPAPVAGAEGKAVATRKGREVKPEQVIPLNDREFEDF
jgi:hypothetical protein